MVFLKKSAQYLRSLAQVVAGLAIAARSKWQPLKRASVGNLRGISAAMANSVQFVSADKFTQLFGDRHHLPFVLVNRYLTPITAPRLKLFALFA